MKKLASSQVAEVLNQVGPALRAVSAENQDLKEKLAHYEKRERAEKLAGVMQAKNLDPDSSYEEKVAGLMNRKDLDVVEQAVEFSAPQIKLAALSDEPGSGGSAEDNFAAALLSS